MLPELRPQRLPSLPVRCESIGQVSFVSPRVNSSREFVEISAIRLCDISRPLAELIEEVNHASPKQVLFFDSRPLIGGDEPHAVNWCDIWSIPEFVAIFINANVISSEVIAHELMHAWLAFYLEHEDHREYANAGDKMHSLAVDCIQSAVLDCKILFELQKRGGFDLTRFRRDIVAAAFENVSIYENGLYHGSKIGAALTAAHLAIPTAFSDLYELDSKEREIIRSLWRICERHEPELGHAAWKITRSLAQNGFNTIAGAVRAIDDSLIAVFEFLGKEFDPKRDMTRRQIEWTLIDKMHEFMRGARISNKHEVVRNAVLSKCKIENVFRRPEDMAINFGPVGSYSAFELPKISHPPARWPSEYSHDPERNPGPRRAMPFNIYEPQYVLAESISSPPLPL